MKALTIEELKALPVGDWVWIEILDKENVEQDFPIRTYLQKSHGAGLNQTHFSFYRFDGICDGFDYSAYGTKWLAYKNKEYAETKGEWVELPCIEPFSTCNIETGEPCICYNILYRDKASGELAIDCEVDEKEAEARLKELRGEK